MKKLSLIAVVIFCQLSPIIVKSNPVSLSIGDVIYVPLEEKDDKKKNPNSRSLNIPIECWCDSLSEELHVVSFDQVRIVEVVLQNMQSLETIPYDLCGASQGVLPLPLNEGTYILSIYTETGKEYWGWFVVEY